MPEAVGIGIIIIMAIGTGTVGLAGEFQLQSFLMAFSLLLCRRAIQQLSLAATPIFTVKTRISDKCRRVVLP